MSFIQRLKPSLLTRFSLITFLITAAIAVGLALGIEHQLEQNALRQAAESAADQVSTILNPNLQPTDLAGPLDPVRYARIDTLVQQNILSKHIVRVKIWNRDGLLLYSDAKEVVGRYFPVSDELKEALAGEIATEVSDLTKEENVAEQGRYDRLFEVYIPLQPYGSTQSVGVYEIYYASDVLEPSLDEMRRFVWVSVGFGFLILYVSLFTLVRNASRELIRRNEENLRLYEEVKQRLAEVEQAEAGRHLSEARFASVLDIAADAIIAADEAQSIILFNKGAEQIFGYQASEVLGQPLDLLLPPRFANVHRQHIHDFAASPEAAQRMGEQLEVIGRRKNGSEFSAETTISKLTQQGQIIFTVILRDVTERKRAEEHIRRQAARAEALAEISQTFAKASLDYEAVLKTVARRVAEMIGDACVVTLLSEDGQWLNPVAFHHPNPEAENSMRELLASKPYPVNSGIVGRVAQTGQPLLVADMPQEQIRLTIRPEYQPYPDRFGIHSLLIVPLRAQGKIIGTLGLSKDHPGRPYTVDDQAFLQEIADRAVQAITNARLYADNLRQLETLFALQVGARKLAESLDSHQLAQDVTRVCVEVFEARLAWIGRAELDGRVSVLAHFPARLEYPRQITVRWDESPHGQGPVGQAIRSRFPVVLADLSSAADFGPWKTDALTYGFRCVAALPLISHDQPFGGLMLYSDQPGFFTPERVEFFQAYAHQAAAALENARLFEETERRLKHVQALHDIDMVISSSFDLSMTLNIILDQIASQLKVDAADVLLLNPRSQMLTYTAGRGFRTAALQRTHLRLGEGNAGRAALARHAIYIADLRENDDSFSRAPLLGSEDFIAYYGVPLIAKGQIKGVLEIFHRAPLAADDEWRDFLETLAGQAAIALDNTSLFDNLQRANVELAVAYDATIEGWSRALDLRDKETEGHTQRVTKMTERLAGAMKLEDAELVHIRRGALLHDIGKMGVPDSILLKPDKLTDDEWAIMRKHPEYAYEMLLPIDFLRPALDIPYYHHEKWDGAGYPRGLKGEQIPLAARIFAVVDVWDALRSDRPYRPAWPEEEIREHIRSLAGIHFDPEVVKVFLETVSS